MKKSTIFWISYSDLMTTLFFVMLVLFALTVSYLVALNEATKEKLQKIKELQTSVQQLPDEYFSYQEQYKRFKLKRQISFELESDSIDSIDQNYLIDVGQSISDLIDSLETNDEYRNLNIKYLVIIEGMASKDSYPFNFELSYKRSLSLYNLWKKNDIKFPPEVCEVQIAGSGTDGTREYFGTEEYQNQQIFIHIVPKMGKILNKE